MNFKSIILLVFCTSITLFSKTLNAQTADTTLKDSQIELNAKLFGLGLNYEAKLGEKFTILSEIGVRTGTGSYGSRYNFADGFKVYNLEIGIEPRLYYNVQKRLNKGKSIKNNAANFWFFGLNYGFKPFNSPVIYQEVDVYDNGLYLGSFETQIEKYSLLSVTPGWGIQRKVGKNFSLDLNLGLSLSYVSEESGNDTYVFPSAGLKFGYVLK